MECKACKENNEVERRQKRWLKSTRLWRAMTKSPYTKCEIKHHIPQQGGCRRAVIWRHIQLGLDMFGRKHTCKTK